MANTQNIQNNSKLFGQEFLTKESRYNKALYFIRNPPADCRITAIVPNKDFLIKRLTRDVNKLNAGYELGRQAGFAAIINDNVK